MDGIAIVVLCDCSSSAMNQKKNERNVRETPPSHVDNDFSHFLFSTAFHINDALLSSCMLTITSLDDFSRRFTTSVKNLIRFPSISVSYNIATLSGSSPLLNALKTVRQRSNITHIVSNGNVQRSLRAKYIAPGPFCRGETVGTPVAGFIVNSDIHVQDFTSLSGFFGSQ